MVGGGGVVVGGGGVGEGGGSGGRIKKRVQSVNLLVVRK
jgi:hypothetical protein